MRGRGEGNQDAQRVLAETWLPTVASIAVLMPLIADGPIVVLGPPGCARSLINAVERRRDRKAGVLDSA
jgi:hypothetical protein